MFDKTALAIATIGALLLGTIPTRAKPAKSAQRAASIVEACKGRDGWSDPAPPQRLYGNSYYVGTCGISVLLITSPRGHILIDGATAEAVPSILANIRTLGFDPRDVRIIVGSHEHIDHMGGFAALKAATGAKLMVRTPARQVVETGLVDAEDPQAGSIDTMVPVAVDATIKPGVPITVDPRATALLPHATPGHTSGGTSWTWRSCERKRCLTFAYVDSLSAISREGYRFRDNPARVAPFRATFATVLAMPCDVLVTPHPGVSALFARMSGQAPLVDRQACRRLADASAARLDARLTEEAKQ